jgi:hypothetical protein
MSDELSESREEDIEILESEETEQPHECGNHELHEATAEYLTETSETPGFEPSEVDPAQIEEAHRLSEKLGDEGLQKWLHDEVAEDLQKALDRAEG